MPRPPPAVLARTVAADAVPDADLLTRFRRGDATAFEALARRHNGRVWAACRGVLGDTPDAEDAFQAAFVVLARDPAAVRNGQSVGSWLYGVAHRIALKALARRNRRTLIEARAVPPADAPPPDPSWREAVAILHEELDRLPDKYRHPLMLCYLEGLSRDEAATALGYSGNVVKGRLERGREVLRRRLTRRGIALSAGLLAAVAGDARSDPGPSVFGLAEAITQPAVAALAASRNTPPIWFRLAGFGLAASVLLGIVLGLPKSPPAEPPKKGPPRPVAKAEPTGERITFSGTVFDPKGKPVAGAKVYLFRNALPTEFTGPDSEVRATTDSVGRFRFDQPAGRWSRYSMLFAAADGFGPAATAAPKDGLADVRLELADDTPIRGRIRNLEGKPVARAAIWAAELGVPKEGVDGWVKAAGERGWHRSGLSFHFDTRLLSAYVRHPVPDLKATTDSDGAFTLTGVGRGRVAVLVVEGTDIATTAFTVLTGTGTPGSIPSVGPATAPTHPYFCGPVDWTVAPGVAYEGRVTDKDTGRPVRGLRIEGSHADSLHPIPVADMTDEDGRYRLRGMPSGRWAVCVWPGPSDPYFAHTRAVGRPGGLEPVRLDFSLKRTAWLTGRLTEERSGKPVPYEGVFYEIAAGNAAVKEYGGSNLASQVMAMTDADGRFRIKAVPGPGWLFTYCSILKNDRVPARERDVQGDVRDRTPPDVIQVASGPLKTDPHAMLVAVTAAVEKEADYAVTVDAGVDVTVRLTDPTGRRITGAVAFGAEVDRDWTDPFPGDPVVRRFNPARPRPVTFAHAGRGLALRYQPPVGDAGPWAVTIPASGTLVGKLVRPDGGPLVDTALTLAFSTPGPDGSTDPTKPRFKTDADGRFKLTNVVPDIDNYLWYRWDAGAYRQRHEPVIRVKPGETKDLGTITMKVPPG